MKELKFINGSLYVYEDGKLIMKTRGNPTKMNQTPFVSDEEAFTWYEDNYSQEEILPENLNEENI